MQLDLTLQELSDIRYALQEQVAILQKQNLPITLEDHMKVLEKITHAETQLEKEQAK